MHEAPAMWGLGRRDICNSPPASEEVVSRFKLVTLRKACSSEETNVIEKFQFFRYHVDISLTLGPICLTSIISVTKMTDSPSIFSCKI